LAGARQHQHFVHSRLTKRNLRQHLLQPVEVLESRQQRIDAERDIRYTEAKTDGRVRRQQWPVMPAHDTRGPLVAGRGITAARRRAAGDDHLDDAALLPGCLAADLGRQRFEFPKRDPQPLAAVLQALQVQCQPARLTVAAGDGLEQPVTVLQAAIGAIDAMGGAPVD
jgi:hypothetical protein